MKATLFLLSITIMLVKGEPPRPVYGPPSLSGGGYPSGGPGGGGGDDLSEPANYMFAYEVQDDKAGVNFGHMEGRQGDSAQGSYHVLLPDGRTQKVDYTADQGGFKPKVAYDGVARPDSGRPASSYGPPPSPGADAGGYRY